MMKRLTTDAPSGNFETMLNFVHGKDGWAHIYDADGKEVNLITWALNQCHDRGCDDFQCKTLEEYDEALSSCMVDFMDCPIAMAYCFASQAVHLRSRLKMYEDTDLDPDQITELMAAHGTAILELSEYRSIGPAKYLLELAQAEKDGRLVVLPCKVGDTVYVLGERRVVDCFIGETYLDNQEGIKSLVSFTCDSDCDGCPFSSWSQDYSGEYSCSGEYGEASILGTDFGKTVFLTREEAEAALKKGEEAT